MLRSMFTAIAGLKNHQLKLDVVANNMANVNTIGFKKGRINFQDILSQTLTSSGAPTAASVGGTNPKQVGLGMTIGAIDNLFNQGSLQVTGVNTDLGISGNGLFILNDGATTRYIRAGNFAVDGVGTLVNAADGWNVQGWQADAAGVINTTTAVGNIQIPTTSTVAPTPTGDVDFVGNFDSTSAIGDTKQTSIVVYDSLGAAHTLIFHFQKTAANTWDWAAVPVTYTDPSITGVVVGGALPMVFNASGALPPAGATDTVTVSYVAGPTTPQVINANFAAADVTQYASADTLIANDQDGYTSGTLIAWNVGNDGIIQGSYSNGLRRNIAQIGMAHFSNYSGLLKEGDNAFTPTSNSGLAQVGTAQTGGRGQISAGTLEMSNVDLAEEFTSMITAQRGFQANSRTITTSDEILQEVMNMKR